MTDVYEMKVGVLRVGIRNLVYDHWLKTTVSISQNQFFNDIFKKCTLIQCQRRQCRNDLKQAL